MAVSFGSAQCFNNRYEKGYTRFCWHIYHTVYRCKPNLQYNYNKSICFVAGDYYNISPGSRDINEYGRPHPFESRDLPNYPLGFPIVIEDGLSQLSVQYVFEFLTKGNFIDTLTTTLKMRIVTYNSALQVFGYAPAQLFSWKKSIALTYPRSISTHMVSLNCTFAFQLPRVMVGSW